MSNKKTRAQNKTLLLVGEGYSDEAFLHYLKEQFVVRGSGLVVTIKNAKGKGAKHVIEWTIRQVKNTGYDVVAVLFDTDTDWTKAVEKNAKTHKLNLLTSDPCFEAMLLRILGITPELDSKKLKSQFNPYVKRNPTESNSYAHYFGTAVLLANRHKEPTIDKLLSLLKA